MYVCRVYKYSTNIICPRHRNISDKWLIPFMEEEFGTRAKGSLIIPGLGVGALSHR